MATTTAEIQVRADTTQAQESIRALRTEVEELRTELGRSPRLEILSEPLTYQARLVRNSSGKVVRAVSTREDHSYIGDLVLSKKRGDLYARARLDRHAQEMRVLAEQRQRIFHPDVQAEFEQRAVGWTNGAGGYFAPPLWMVEHFAVQPTPERVLASLAPQFDLPVGAQSVNIPAFQPGSGPDVQAQGSPGDPVTSPDTTTIAIGSAVATIAGNYDVPLQMLEQSPQGAHLDWLAFTAMEERYGGALETQLITGVGSVTPQGSANNLLCGILNNPLIPTANKITYTDATPSATHLLTVTGGASTSGACGFALAAVGNSRKRPPEYWMTTTSRSVWIVSQEVSIPMALNNQTGPGEYDLLTYPVKLNDAIPTNLNGNQDTMIVVRPSDWIILESDRHTQVMPDVLSGTMEVRLQMRRYVAALLRRPESVAYITGTGMAVQSGF